MNLGLIFFLSLSLAAGNNEVLGYFGATYPIVEPDALEEIERRVAAIDWDKRFKEPLREQYRIYRSSDAVSLPKAKLDRTFQTDPTYTLEYDIPDGKGGVVYPSGYTYNPLKYFSLPNTLVVINAEDEDQLGWLDESGFLDNPETTLLITQGSANELASQLKRPVHYLTRNLAKRLSVRSVPSIIKQTGSVFKIREIYVKKHPSD